MSEAGVVGPAGKALGTLTTSRSQIWDFRKKTLPLHSHITPWWWNGRHEGLRHVL